MEPGKVSSPESTPAAEQTFKKKKLEWGLRVIYAILVIIGGLVLSYSAWLWGFGEWVGGRSTILSTVLMAFFFFGSMFLAIWILKRKAK